MKSVALRYVNARGHQRTAILARRLNAANRVLVELKTQLKADQRGSLEKTIETMEGLLGSNSVTNLALLT